MGKRGIFYGLLVLIIASGVVFVQSINSEAGVKGPCSECHTMHNSQDGGTVNEVQGQEVDAQSYLIKGADLSEKNPCLGCHKTGAGQYFQDPTKQEGNVNNDAPQINVDPGSTNNRLSAAGTYYFVTKEETGQGEKSCRKGHNVLGMSDSSDDNEDQLLKKIPPGGSEACLGGAGKQLTCAGTSGCHGKRDVDDPLAAIKGGHHSPATNNYEDRFRDGNSIATSYRMLNGVKGRVASNWEFGDVSTATDNFFTQLELASKDDVNIYQGADGKLSGTMTYPGDGSINGLCGECHGNGDSENGFHSVNGLKGKDSTTMSSPWKRHPTDVVMRQDAQYGGYPGETGKDYSREVPVGFLNITKTGGTNELQKAQRVVLCVSCHRAHGSQYDDALRWDYKEMATASTTGNGCFRCHTNKYKKP